MRIPATHLADTHASAPAGTYMYEFPWPSPALGGRLGVFHGLEIPFVFDTVSKTRRSSGSRATTHRKNSPAHG